MAEEDPPIEEPTDIPDAIEEPTPSGETPEFAPDHDAAVDPTPSRAAFQQLQLQDLGELEKFVERYNDVPMHVSIELGRVPKSLRDILEWKEGSIVETQKLSGMPMEIMVNGSLFGKGEVVVVGDNLAIRITELQKPDLT
tara:strand:+ start:1326 stop:1745 length:420 start_codon:yes stop_codon:yes gene_type:complete